MATDTTSRKYELTDDFIIENGHTLYQIRALRDIPYHNVGAGDLGGFIESEANLSHEDDCWVDMYACVYERAHVSEDAIVSDWARVFGRARISGHASVYEEACVYGRAQVMGDAIVRGRARVSGRAVANGNSSTFGKAHVLGGAVLAGCDRVGGDAHIFRAGHVLPVEFIGFEGSNMHIMSAFRIKEGGAGVSVIENQCRSSSGIYSIADLERFLMNKCGHENYHDECRHLIGMLLSRADGWKEPDVPDDEDAQLRIA